MTGLGESEKGLCEKQSINLLTPVRESDCGAEISSPRVALALSGGGARGLSQIGVIRALEENGISIDAICGVSMGAIIGGFYAAGIGPDSLEALVRRTEWSELLQNTPTRASLLLSQKDEPADWFLSIPLRGVEPVWPTGVSSGQRLYNFLSGLTQRATYLSGSDFDSLKVRFRAVSTDLVNGERVVFAGGELASALRASMAFPLAVTPLHEGGSLLADGGLIDPLPVELADSLSDCPVVAINTASGLAPISELDDPYALANQATSVMTSERIARSRAAADFLCEPIGSEIANVDFDELDTILALGHLAGTRLAAEIKAAHGTTAPAVSVLGERPSLVSFESVSVEGNETLSDSILTATLELIPGRSYTFDDLRLAVGKVEARYVASRFSLARVTAAMLDSTGNLQMQVDEGRLAGIELIGNLTVKNWVVLRSFPLQRGEPYHSRKVARGLADLHAAGLFDQVTTEVVGSPEGPILRLRVTERSTDALRLGLHHNLEYQTEGFVQWAKTNLFGLGNELTLHAQYAPRREHYFAKIESDRILRTYLTGSLRLFHHEHERRHYQDHEAYTPFLTTRDGFEFTLGQNISRFAQMACIITAEDIDFEVDSSESEYQHARIALVARFDDLDDADFPTDGRRAFVQLSWGDNFLGGDLIYRAFQAAGEWFYSPGKRLTFSVGGHAGTADRVLPLHEQFALGGRRSFMGLAEDELLGDRLVAGTMTARYRVYPISYAMLRLDAGNAWSKDADIDFWEEIRGGAGGGLMFDTPLGPLTLLYGYAGRGDTKFYFSWGYDF